MCRRQSHDTDFFCGGRIHLSHADAAQLEHRRIWHLFFLVDLFHLHRTSSQAPNTVVEDSASGAMKSKTIDTGDTSEIQNVFSNLKNTPSMSYDPTEVNLHENIHL